MSLIIISGGSGLIGSNLTRHLLDRNHDVVILTREKNKTSEDKRIQYSFWDVTKQVVDVELINKADHIIHLAGAGVMDKKWTAEYKKEIVNSRTKSAELLINSIDKNNPRIRSFISASAIGYYGPDQNPLPHKDGFIETDLPAPGFLGETCVLWEASSEPVKQSGIRLVKFRTGIVLANGGGALQEFKTPLKFGVAPIFGNGKQIISWIHIDDLCRMYCDAIENDFMQGVYNAVAPEPVSQKKFMIKLGQKVKNRFLTPMHIPHFMLKLILGKRSIEILKSATVSNKKIKASGFTFLYPSLDAALDDLDDNK